MKEKVEEQEALAEAYGDIASSATSVDDEIDKALKSSNTQADDSLARLKAKMAMAKGGA
jgi:phage shock protein A